MLMVVRQGSDCPCIYDILRGSRRPISPAVSLEIDVVHAAKSGDVHSSVASYQFYKRGPRWLSLAKVCGALPGRLPSLNDMFAGDGLHADRALQCYRAWWICPTFPTRDLLLVLLPCWVYRQITHIGTVSYTRDQRQHRSSTCQCTVAKFILHVCFAFQTGRWMEIPFFLVI